MNAIDILGGLLGVGKSGGKRGGGSSGGVGDILADILGGNSTPTPQTHPRASGSSASSLSPEQLEDMLGVGRDSGSRQSPVQLPHSPSQPQSAPRNSPQSQSPHSQSTHSQSTQLPTDIFGQRQRQEPKVNLSIPKPTPLSQNDQAVLLIRAMINSAKVDGEISEDEQKSILDQVGDTSPETVQFLRAEFARPLDVVQYAQSLPIGMEQKAYNISLMAIKLDSKEEADYLRQLAKALRISPETCNQLHQQQNAPALYA